MGRIVVTTRGFAINWLVKSRLEMSSNSFTAVALPLCYVIALSFKCNNITVFVGIWKKGLT